MSNGGGSGSGSYSYADRNKQMAAFDSLPPMVREALRNAVFDWAPYPILTRIRRNVYMRRGGAKAIVKDISRWDRDALKKRARSPRR